MNTERLLKLASFLDVLPAAKFNFAVIAEEGDKPMLEALAAGEHNCGTVACAIGWAPAIFPELDWAVPPYRPPGLYTVVLKGKEAPSYWATTSRTAEVFFDINWDEVQFLFVPAHCNNLSEDSTAHEVAEHIRKFVSNEGIYE